MATTDKLLAGYEVKPDGKQNGFGHGKAPQVEGESYTVSDKPSGFVCSLFDKLESFEANHTSNIGKLHMIIATVLITLILVIKQEVLVGLPAVEVIFVCFLTNLIVNYYLMDGALFKPFLDSEENSKTIKVNGFLAVGAVACLFYGLNFIPLATALTVFYSSFFLAIIFEIVILKESYKSNEVFLALGALAGAAITIMGSSGDLWAGAPPVETASAVSGFVLSALSAVFTALVMMNFGKMSNENITSVTHIFTLIIALFTPVFFPIQGVITPSMNQWGFLALCGLMTSAATLFFIRSLQIETGARTVVFLSLQVALVFIIEMLLAKASGAAGLVGAAVTIGCVWKYNQDFESKGLARKNIVEQEGLNSQEMHEINRGH